MNIFEILMWIVAALCVVTALCLNANFDSVFLCSTAIAIVLISFALFSLLQTVFFRIGRLILSAKARRSLLVLLVFANVSALFLESPLIRKISDTQQLPELRYNKQPHEKAEGVIH